MNLGNIKIIKIIKNIQNNQYIASSKIIDKLKYLNPEIVSKSLRPEDKNNILKFEKS